MAERFFSAPLTGISTCHSGTEGVRTIPGWDTPRVSGNAQDLTKILGKVIRIDIDHTSPGKLYAIPADNPFLSNPNAVPEIYALRFQEPCLC